MMTRQDQERSGVAADESARLVALAVLRSGPVSRADLARQLGLSTPSLTRLTRPMLDTGLMIEQEADGRRRAGRPSRPLDIDPSLAQFIGIKITGDIGYAVVCDLKGAELARDQRPVVDRSPVAVARLIAGIVDDQLREWPRIAGVGVSLGGTVDGHGVVRRAPFLGWDEVQLADDLQAAIGLPVTVDNDVRALAHAEHWFGAGRGVSSFVVITVGVGTGCAIVIDDRAVAGRDGLAALIGHWILDPDGPACVDGDHYGCASAILSTGAISDAASRELGRAVSFEQCVGLATAGDPAAVRIVRYAADMLGLLTARIADLLAPQRILITGDGVGFVLAAEDALDDALRRHRSVEADRDDIRIHRSDFFDWARGAAAVAIRHYVLNDLPVS